MNFSQVNDSIRAFLNKPEAEGYFPRFFEMAEAEMNRRLDCQAMDDVAPITISAETTPVPCDFAGVKAFRLATSPLTKLEYRRPDAFDETMGYEPASPRYYTIVGDSFLFAPVPSTAVQARLRYRKRLAPLCAANISNWVSDKFPDVYIYGVLKHAGIFLGDDRLPLWSAAFDAALDAANNDANVHDYGSTLQTQHSGAV